MRRLHAVRKRLQENLTGLKHYGTTGNVVVGGPQLQRSKARLSMANAPSFSEAAVVAVPDDTLRQREP